MGDRSVGFEMEYPKTSKNTHDAYELLGQNATRRCEFSNAGCALWGDPVSDPKIGDEPNGSRNLKASDKEIECHPVVFRNAHAW